MMLNVFRVGMNVNKPRGNHRAFNIQNLFGFSGNISNRNDSPFLNSHSSPVSLSARAIHNESVGKDQVKRSGKHICRRQENDESKRHPFYIT